MTMEIASLVEETDSQDFNAEKTSYPLAPRFIKYPASQFHLHSLAKK